MICCSFLRPSASFFASLLLCLFATYAGAQPTAPRPRLVITADPELDDNNSLIRLLLYSSDVNIEGLIYASSQFHWKGDGKGTKWYVPGREYSRFGLNLCPCESWRWAKDERFIHDIVDAYAKVYPNLKLHNASYPSPAALRANIRYGNIEFDGDISKDSPGSNLIRALILDDKPGPLFLAAWGGQSTIARALKSIQDQYQHTTGWETLRRNIARKVILLPSGDQDDTYATYIRPNWPDIEYRQFRGGPNYGYGAQLRASPENPTFLTADWMRNNVSSRGPLGALYRVWGDGKQMVKGDKLDYFGLAGYTNEELKKQGYVVWMPVQPKGSWLGEGDNPTFMNMLDNGLRAYENGTYGGWGGISQPGAATGNPFAAPTDTSAGAMVATLGAANARRTDNFPNFFPAAQRDFAARLKWAVTPRYAGANHAPIVRIEGPLTLMANPGQTLRLNGAVSDPDGNAVTVRWWHFRAGTYPSNQYDGVIAFSAPDALQTEITIPKDVKPGQTIHLVLEATDNGTPALTRYQRVLVTIRSQ